MRRRASSARTPSSSDSYPLVALATTSRYRSRTAESWPRQAQIFGLPVQGLSVIERVVGGAAHKEQPHRRDGHVSRAGDSHRGEP